MVAYCFTVGVPLLGTLLRPRVRLKIRGYLSWYMHNSTIYGICIGGKGDGGIMISNHSHTIGHTQNKQKKKSYGV